jgi:DNA-binding NarL/FixJ family response regulator
MNVLIIDDHPVVAEYLRNAAGRAIPDAVIRLAGDLETAFESMRENPAEMVMLDLGLPGCGGVESVLRFRKAFPDARVVVISSEDERNSIRGCLALGAAGFIPKTAGPREMVNALRVVAEGGRYIPPEVLVAEPAAAPKESASKRGTVTAKWGLSLFSRRQPQPLHARRLDLLFVRQHRDVLAARPGLAKRLVVRRQDVARLSAGVDVERVVEIA